MNPFKIKKDYENYKVLELAKDVFGPPTSQMFGDSIDFLETYQELVWHFCDNYSFCSLTICKKQNSEQLDINIKQESFESESCISVNIKQYNPDWSDKLKKFVRVISKHWSDWREEEITSDPMWIYYFQRENRIVPESIHCAMVLFSYKEPSNIWVRRYFDDKNKICNQKNS